MAESLHLRCVAGIEMIVAIDSTLRGPALGGCRWRPYADVDAAQSDARALAGAMTRKAALARLSLGGGKAVVRGDPRLRSAAQLRALGDFVESLGGRYIAAADMGTGAAEMAVLRSRTRHVVGLPEQLGGCGDPGPWTALGLRMALEAAAREIGTPLAELSVAVQGVGSVGGAFARALVEDGARVFASDPSAAALRALPREVEVVTPEEITRLSCDVFSPCGPPAVIDAELAARLDCRIVCGAANNPLACREAADVLDARDVLYVPDFLANAGGLIHLAVHVGGGDAARTREQLGVIPDNLRRVLEHAKSSGGSTAQAAEELARAALLER